MCDGETFYKSENVTAPGFPVCNHYVQLHIWTSFLEKVLSTQREDRAWLWSVQDAFYTLCS